MKQLVKIFLISMIVVMPVFAFIVFEVLAAPLSLTQGQCVGLPGEWITGTNKTCTVTSTATITQLYTIDNKQSLIISDTGSLTIKNGASLTIKNGGELTNNGTLTNNGDLNIISGGSLVNSGTISTSKRLLIRNSTLIINNGGSLINTENLDIKNGGKLTIKSGGNLTNNDLGALTITTSSNLSNTGTLDNEGTLTSGGDLTNDGGGINNQYFIEITGTGRLTNTGTMTNTGTLANGGDLTNDDTLDNSGSLTIESGGNLTNTKILTNSGSLTIKNNGSLIIDHSTFSNKGSLTIEVGGWLRVSSPVFFDDMESGWGNWTFTGWWAQITGDYHSATHSWTDSPGGNYDNNTNISLTSVPFNLTSDYNPTLSFWTHYAIESGFDQGYIEISTDGGLTWTMLTALTGFQNSWVNQQVSLAAYAGQPSVQMRFRLNTDYSITYDGWYIDDVRIGERISIINTGYLINYGIFENWGIIRNDNSLYNGGNLINDGPSGVLVNSSSGTFYNLYPTGHLVNQNGAKLINEDGGTFYNFDDFENEGDFENQGQVNPAISGPMTLTPAHHEPIIILTITNNGTLYNYNTVKNTGIFTNNYIIYNYGEFANPGIIYNCSGIIIPSPMENMSGNPPESCAGNIHSYLPIIFKGG